MWFINFCLSLPETCLYTRESANSHGFKTKKPFGYVSMISRVRLPSSPAKRLSIRGMVNHSISFKASVTSKAQGMWTNQGWNSCYIYILYSYVSYVYIFHIDQTFPNIQKPLPMSHPIHPFKTIEKSILNTKNFKDHWSMPPLGLFPWLCSFCKGCRWWWSITWKLWFLRRKCLPSITYPIWHPNVSKMARNNEIQDKVMTKCDCI